MGERRDLVIVHLYPDLLKSYGDRGNVLTLAKRAEWRGFTVRIAGITRAEPLPATTDLIVIGGGSDHVQHLIGADLVARRRELVERVETCGTTIFGVCGGYQALGHRYMTGQGVEILGVGLLDVTTQAGGARIVGRVTAEANFDGRSIRVSGFENHAGRTFLGPQATTLGRVPKGQGNNGLDNTEGAVQGGVIGTYLHGPVLPTAPALADGLLARALRRATGGAPLKALDDDIEEGAARSARVLNR